MKKLYILAIGALFFSSCEKLDREVITDVSKKNFDASYSFVLGKVTSVYTELPSGYGSIGGDAMLASATDEAEHTFVSSNIQKFNTGNWNAYDNPDNVWDNNYRGIRRANQFLASVHLLNLDQYKLDPNTQALYNLRLAESIRWPFEVRFLRAYFYFELVKRYGGVPIFEKEITSEDFANVKRNTFAECIKFITDECDAAANALPLVYPTVADYGRVTKGAALAFKSRVLLYAASELFNTATPYLSMNSAANNNLICYTNYDVARWQAAANAAKAAIDLAGTGYALHANSATNPSYKAVFQNFNSPEIIFSRRLGSTNTFEVNNAPVGFNGARGLTTPSQNLVDAYEVKVNATTTVPFDWNNPVHAANPYANRDPRLELSVITNNSKYKPFAAATPVTVDKRAIETFTGGLDASPLPNATRTGYYIRKHVAEGTLNNVGSFTTNAVHNWALIRLPELYLNYAEALNEYDPTNPDIKKYVDLVRARLGVAMPPITLGSQAQNREKIRNERRVELAFEDHRAWDVRRWKQAELYLGAPLRGVDVVRTAVTPTPTFTYTPFVVETRVFDPKMYLYPIPQTDIDISPLMLQNPRW